MKTDFTLVYDLIPSPIGEVGIVRCPRGAFCLDDLSSS